MPGGTNAKYRVFTVGELVNRKVANIIKYTPSGDSIPDETWRRRHRNIVIALLAHIPFLLALGLYSGTDTYTGATIPETSLSSIALRLGVVTAVGLLAAWPRFGRRTRSSLATAALAMSSSVLVYFSGGYIEAHFHFFVVMGIVAVYEDWVPFLIGILFVAVQHALFGVVAPEMVYNHAAGATNPFVWAVIHAVFVLMLASALMTNWYSIERSREQTRKQLAETEEAEAMKAKAEAREREVAQLNDHLEAKADTYRATMERAADGELTVRLDPESESEAMTEIATAYNEMMDEMETAMSEIQTFAQEVTEASEEASLGAGEVKQASAEVSEAIQEISGGAEEQREMLEAVYGKMTDLSATVEEVASSAETVAETSHQTAQVATEGEATAERAISEAQDGQAAINSTVEHVERLDDRMDEIGEIVDLISEVAEQTNLLALNANIEAARVGANRSGATGDGFAVVADEIKQLAEETQASANEIDQLIEETQAQTAATVDEAQRAEAYMEEGVDAVDDVVAAFTQVATNADETDSGIQEISAAADEQAVSAEEAVSRVESVSDISKSTANEAQSVSAAAQEQASSITQVSTNVQRLAEQAERLQSLVGKFEASAGSTSQERAFESQQSGQIEANQALGDGGQFEFDQQ